MKLHLINFRGRAAEVEGRQRSHGSYQGGRLFLISPPQADGVNGGACVLSGRVCGPDLLATLGRDVGLGGLPGTLHVGRLQCAQS